ncbi:MAG: MATE family efflux transporter [Clostridia bacterium]|nr:MATE family efflux transporter [Clostridia bacterium]
MTHEAIPSLVTRLSIPTIISMLVTTFYNMADTFFVGQLGTSATGAVGVVFAVMAVIQALGFTFGHGSGNYISRSLGAGDDHEASRMATTAFVSAFLSGTLLLVTGLTFLEPLVYLLGATSTIAPYAKEYLSYILIGAPWMTASLVLNNQLRYQGNAVYAMAGLVSGAVINVILDPILIFVCHMGVSGAALATIISQAVGFCLLFYGTTKGGSIRLHPLKFSPTLAQYKEIVRGGMPSFFRQTLGSIATTSLNLAAGPYGDAAIAAMSIVGRIAHFCSSAMIGFGQGFQPVCGFNYGAKQYPRVRAAFWFAVKISTVVLLVLAILGLSFADPLITLFRRDDAEVIRIGSTALRLQMILLPLLSLTILTNMMLQVIGKSFRASILSTARQGLFFLPLIFALPRFIGLWGVMLSQPLADLCSLMMALPLARAELKELHQLEMNVQNAPDAES